jgi:hypothetical protein
MLNLFFKHLLDEIMGVNELWIQDRVYKETETCHRGLYVCIFASPDQYKGKICNNAQRGP